MAKKYTKVTGIKVIKVLNSPTTGKHPQQQAIQHSLSDFTLVVFILIPKQSVDLSSSY